MTTPFIDWLRVDMVCNGTPLKLTPIEKRMVVRRLVDKMRINNKSMYGRCLTSDEVARRLGVEPRSVERLKTELAPADKRTCPICREPMWVIGSEVEPHPDRLFNECPMSYSQTRRGLASIRPDLYAWAQEVSA
jgi:hypothetical protein